MFFERLKMTNKTYIVAVQSLTQSYTSGVLGAKTWTTYKTVDCIFWKGGANDSSFSNKVRADVTAVCILNPKDISASAIKDSSRLLIYDTVYNCAVNNVAGYGIGETEILIDGINDKNRPVKPGDIVSISADTGGTDKAVTAVRFTTVTTGIKITPALVHAIADNDVVVITPVIGYYSVINADNIALQDKIIYLPLKDMPVNVLQEVYSEA